MFGNKDNNVAPLAKGVGAGIHNKTENEVDYSLGGGAAYHEQQSVMIPDGMTDIGEVGNHGATSNSFGLGATTPEQSNSFGSFGSFGESSAPAPTPSSTFGSGSFDFNNGGQNSNSFGGFGNPTDNDKDMFNFNNSPSVDVNAPTKPIVNPFEPIPDQVPKTEDTPQIAENVVATKAKGSSIKSAIAVGVVAMLAGGGFVGYQYLKAAKANQQVEVVEENKDTINEDMASIEEVVGGAASEPVAPNVDGGTSSETGLPSLSLNGAEPSTTSTEPPATDNNQLTLGANTATTGAIDNNGLPTLTNEATLPTAASDVVASNNVATASEVVKSETKSEVKTEVKAEVKTPVAQQTETKTEVKTETSNVTTTQAVEANPSVTPAVENTNTQTITPTNTATTPVVNPSAPVEQTSAVNSTPVSNANIGTAFLPSDTNSATQVQMQGQAQQNNVQSHNGANPAQAESQAERKSYERQIRELRAEADRLNEKADALVRERNSLEQRLFGKTPEQQVEILRQEVSTLKSKQRARVAQSKRELNSVDENPVARKANGVKKATRAEHIRSAKATQSKSKTQQVAKSTAKREVSRTVVSSSGKLPYTVYAAASGVVMLKTSQNSPAISYVVGDRLPNGEVIQNINFFNKTIKTSRRTYSW